MGIFSGNNGKAAAKPAAKRATASRTAAKLAEGKPVTPSDTRDTRADQTPDAKVTQPAKREAAERQFAKADAKNETGRQNANEPTRQDNARKATDDNPNIAAAKTAAADNEKALAQAEKDRKAAKAEAMKPATPEQIAEATQLRAVRGY